MTTLDEIQQAAEGTEEGAECVCAKCREDYSLRENCEPSKHCDRCVHDVVADLEKLLAAEWGLGCYECGAEWMGDSALDKLSDTVEPLKVRIAELEASLSAATARASELEKIVAAGDRLCVAAVRCGIHTWSSIPPEGIHRALQFGCRMHEYINASPTFEWPFDDDAANVTAEEARASARGDRVARRKATDGKGET